MFAGKRFIPVVSTLRSSRNLSKACTPLFTATLKPVLKASIAIQSRQFSASAGLASVLKKEIAEEIGHKEKPDPEFLDVQKKILKSFKISDPPGLGLVTMTANINGETVVVEFDCQELEELEPTDEEIQAMENSESTEDDEDGDGFPNKTGNVFTVKVTKGSDMINFGCTASDMITINKIELFTDGIKESQWEDVYGGPEFDTLAEDVQKSFYDYLEERNIDEDLCYFIISYAKDKEQREYLNWLEKTVAFIGKK